LKFLNNVIFIISSFFLAITCGWGQNYSISTIAGQGLAFGDGGPAANAKFGAISAVAMGADGSLYIADSIYHQVRKVTPDGKISLFAGGTVRGFAGDGGPATSALLDTPTALVVESGGSVYIGDSGNHRVRVVTPYGFIQTVAGNGQIAPDPGISPVLPGEGGPATAAPLNQISGLAFDSNSNLIISDLGNNRIFQVSGGIIKTLAGNATTAPSLADQPALPATLSGPTGVATDLFGDIYFSELKTAVVRMIDPTGKMTRFIGTGSLTDQPIASGSPLSYPLIQPIGMASDAALNLYIIETGRISQYTPPNAYNTSATVQAIAGNLSQKVSSGTGDGGSPLSAGMNPRSIAISSQFTIYLADSLATPNFNNRVRMILNNTISTYAGGNAPTGKGDGSAATSAELYFPQALAIDPNKGTVYIADTGDNRVRAVTADGKINTIAGTGTAGTTGNGGSATAANLNAPAGLALDSNGNLYVTDGTLIRQVSAAGAIGTFAGGGTSTQEGAAEQSAALTQSGSLAVDAQNDVFVDQLARVSEVSSATQLINTVAGNGTSGYSGDNGPGTAAQIGGSAGVAVDANGNLYIADGANGRVRKVDTTGAITTFAGGGTSKADGVSATTAALNNPVAVAADPQGNVYIAEYSGNRIRVVNAGGTIRTIAGNGPQGFSGDGAVSTNASLNGPADVKVDPQGNVYIADSMNSSIRKLTPLATLPTPAISTIANAGSMASGPMAPGERVVISGTDLGPGSTVMFGSYAAPVVTSSFTSTLAVVPYEVSGQTASQVTVTTNGVTSAPFAVQLASSAPGIYTMTGDGQGQAYAFGPDGNFNTFNNPAPAGTDVYVLCTGEGLENPASATGVPIGATPPSPVLPVTATVGGEMANVDQVYAVPGTIGMFLVAVSVPSDISSSASIIVTIMVGSAVSQNSATIAVLANQEAGSDNGNDGSDLKRSRRPVKIRVPGMYLKSPF
jgi:uncharacterized protein (TIGR03437 family)